MKHDLTPDRLEYWRHAAQTAHDDRPGTVLYIPAGDLLALVEGYRRMEDALYGMLAVGRDHGTLGGFLKLAARAVGEDVPA